jgi:hypothetical protein
MLDADLEAEQVIEESDDAPKDTAREVTPLQFFKPGEVAAVTDKDFRPSATKVDDTDKGNSPTEDGHGNRSWSPPAHRYDLDPALAHDPSVSPIPERDHEGPADMPEPPTHPSAATPSTEPEFPVPVT